VPSHDDTDHEWWRWGVTRGRRIRRLDSEHDSNHRSHHATYDGGIVRERAGTQRRRCPRRHDDHESQGVDGLDSFVGSGEHQQHDEHHRSRHRVSREEWDEPDQTR
jgi:hypothetical protein